MSASMDSWIKVPISIDMVEFITKSFYVEAENTFSFNLGFWKYLDKPDSPRLIRETQFIVTLPANGGSLEFPSRVYQHEPDYVRMLFLAYKPVLIYNPDNPRDFLIEME